MQLESEIGLKDSNFGEKRGVCGKVSRGHSATQECISLACCIAMHKDCVCEEARGAALFTLIFPARPASR